MTKPKQHACCVICGRTITAKGRYRYCRDKCAKEGVREQVRLKTGTSKRSTRHVECASCGGLFVPYKKGHIYCGKRCWPSKQPETTQRKCELCGRKYTHPTDYRSKQYCSPHCTLRGSRLNSVYGISASEYIELLRSQGFRCAICEQRLDVLPGVSSPQGVVDHDHTTGAVRGVLCSRCNHVLGHADDRTGILMSAAAYLVQRTPTWLQRRREGCTRPSRIRVVWGGEECISDTEQ